MPRRRPSAARLPRSPGWACAHDRASAPEGAYGPWPGSAGRFEEQGMRPETSLGRCGIRWFGAAALAASLGAGAASAADTVSLSLGDVPAGKTITIKIRARISDPFPAASNQVSNQGTVTAVTPSLSLF